MKLELWVYRLLLQAYPKDFRLEFKHEMLQVFRLEFENAKLEKRTLMFWVSVLMDCFCGATREQFFRKGERMNWFVKFCGFSSLILAISFFVETIFRMFHTPGISTANFSQVLLVPRIAFIFLASLGIFGALPAQKNPWEWLGIGSFCLVVALQVFFQATNENSYLYNLTNFVFLAGFLALILARVRFQSTGLDWSDVPQVSKSLMVMIICFSLGLYASTISAPVFETLHYLRGFTRSSTIENRGDIISTLCLSIAYCALSFGIWRSKPTQPNTPNLISG
jgi:hypothetical protein